MWKFVNSSPRKFVRLINLRKWERNFLSEAYRCDDAWNERQRSTLLSKVNSNEIFMELDEKFQKHGKASAVDVDIYTNAIVEPGHNNEIIDIIHKLRLSTETTNTLDSTHHAVIRYLLDNDEIDDLLTILHDRYNYGIFPDHLCYNILMDTFVKRKEFGNAAKIAVLLMLQEDNENCISNELALYCCHKYLENPESWKAPELASNDDGPEVKIRVKYIRNIWFDDHFDLTNPEDLVGKTLVFYGKFIDDVLGRSCRLRGLTLWKKYAEATNLIRDWMKNGTKDCIYAEVLSQIRDNLSAIPEDKVTKEVEEFKTELEALETSGLKEGSVIENIENRVKAAVEKQADSDIAKQCQIYQEWETNRMSILEAQLAELDKKSRLGNVEKIKKELIEKERLVTFFENHKEIELKIWEKLEAETKKFGKSVKKSKIIEDNYMPPEITNKRQ